MLSTNHCSVALQAKLDLLVSDVPIDSASPYQLTFFFFSRRQKLWNAQGCWKCLWRDFCFPMRSWARSQGLHVPWQWRLQQTLEQCFAAGWDPSADSVCSGSVRVGQPMWWQSQLKKSQVQLCRVIGRQELSKQSLPGGETQASVTFLTHYFNKKLRAAWHDQSWVWAMTAALWAQWTEETLQVLQEQCQALFQALTAQPLLSLQGVQGARRGATGIPSWYPTWKDTYALNLSLSSSSLCPFFCQAKIYLEGWSGWKTETDREVFGTVMHRDIWCICYRMSWLPGMCTGQPTALTQQRFICMMF